MATYVMERRFVVVFCVYSAKSDWPLYNNVWRTLGGASDKRQNCLCRFRREFRCIIIVSSGAMPCGRKSAKLFGPFTVYTRKVTLVTRRRIVSQHPSRTRLGISADGGKKCIVIITMTAVRRYGGARLCVLRIRVKGLVLRRFYFILEKRSGLRVEGLRFWFGRFSTFFPITIIWRGKSRRKSARMQWKNLRNNDSFGKVDFVFFFL